VTLFFLICLLAQLTSLFTALLGYPPCNRPLMNNQRAPNNLGISVHRYCLRLSEQAVFWPCGQKLGAHTVRLTTPSGGYTNCQTPLLLEPQPWQTPSGRTLDDDGKTQICTILQIWPHHPVLRSRNKEMWVRLVHFGKWLGCGAQVIPQLPFAHPHLSLSAPAFSADQPKAARFRSVVCCGFTLRIATPPWLDKVATRLEHFSE
jgi:hypothetical protein